MKVGGQVIEQQGRVASGGDVGRDGGEVQVHRRDIAPGQDQPDRLALPGADRAEDLGRGRALVARSGRPGAAPRPAAGALVLLPDPGFVAQPDLCVAAYDAFVLRDRVQTGGETFSKSSIAPTACA